MRRGEMGALAGGAFVQHLVAAIGHDRRDVAVVAKVDGGGCYEIWSTVDGGRFAMLCRVRTVEQVDAQIERLTATLEAQGGTLTPRDSADEGGTNVTLPGLDVVLNTVDAALPGGHTVLSLHGDLFGRDDYLPPLEYYGQAMRPQKASECVRQWLRQTHDEPGLEREKAACLRFLGE